MRNWMFRGVLLSLLCLYPAAVQAIPIGTQHYLDGSGLLSSVLEPRGDSYLILARSFGRWGWENFVNHAMNRGHFASGSGIGGGDGFGGGGWSPSSQQMSQGGQHSGWGGGGFGLANGIAGLGNGIVDGILVIPVVLKGSNVGAIISSAHSNHVSNGNGTRVPEPSTLLLLGSGIGLLFLRSRRAIRRA